MCVCVCVCVLSAECIHGQGGQPGLLLPHPQSGVLGGWSSSSHLLLSFPFPTLLLPLHPPISPSHPLSQYLTVKWFSEFVEDTPTEGGLQSVLRRLAGLYSIWCLHKHVAVLYQGGSVVCVCVGQDIMLSIPSHEACELFLPPALPLSSSPSLPPSLPLSSPSLPPSLSLYPGGYFKNPEDGKLVKDSILALCSQV